ncbi:MAG: hypothetical protein AAF986_03640 [Pseudomonadota bacterium]
MQQPGLFALMVAGALSLGACAEEASPQNETPSAKPMDSSEKVMATKEVEAAADTPAMISLADVLADPRRKDRAARDAFRHPQETLDFFGLTPDMTVVEVWPGGGWYTDILAPYQAAGGGKFIAAGFDPESGEYFAKRTKAFTEKYVSEPEVFGDIEVSVLSKDSPSVASAGTVDLVLTFRNVHNWAYNGFADKAFADFYAALKPGGVLGVVEHRLPEEADIAMEQDSGYMKVSSVVALATAAGFELVAQSEVNANPQDTSDHPFGVWTLPPSSRTESRDGSVPEGFDPEAYKAIGESDRMTLKFVKPLTADGALLQ